MAAPVCNNGQVEDIGDGTGITLPSIPQATDLKSAIAAINALAMGFKIITKQIQPAPKTTTPGRTSSLTTKKPEKGKEGRWNESARDKKTVRVYNPDDNTQFVDVEQITGLTMKDSQTGELWKWKR